MSNSGVSEFIAFIPARANSKGLAGKNTRLLAGKPLIQYTLEAVFGCPNAKVFVSTDDEKVCSIAEDLGISCPYRRPKELASDTASMADTVVDGLRWLEKQGPLPEYLVLLQPTSPFRTSADVLAAVRMLYESDAPSVVGVSPMWTHPVDCVEIGPNGKWRFLIENDFQPKRRQDFKGSFWFINGAIYALRTSKFLSDRQFIHADSALLRMSDENTVDIDLPRDLKIAEALMSKA